MLFVWFFMLLLSALAVALVLNREGSSTKKFAWKTRAALVVLTPILLATAINISGVCFRELRYISNHELIEKAVAHRARDIKQLNGKPSNDAIAAYLAQYPNCCRIELSFLPISLFDKILGFNAKWVRVVHQLPDEEAAKAPRDGNFYEAYVRVGCCGEIYETTGMRLTEIEATSVIGKN